MATQRTSPNFDKYVFRKSSERKRISKRKRESVQTWTVLTDVRNLNAYLDFSVIREIPENVTENKKMAISPAYRFPKSFKSYTI